MMKCQNVKLFLERALIAGLVLSSVNQMDLDSVLLETWN